jgi:ABC-type spermidine/putrescine transport system permease subunit I
MLFVQIALFLVPMAIMFVYSFWTTKNYAIVTDWTFSNYLAFFESSTYPRVLFRTLTYSVVITVITLIASYPLSYFIVRCTKAWQQMLLGAVILSFWTSGLLRAYAWMALLGDAGIINKGLKLLGLIDGPLPYLLYSPFAVILVMVYFSLPFAVITIYASLEKMDWALVDAAADLGASPRKAFWHITVPQTLPGIASAAVLTFVPLMGMFFVPMLMGDASSVMIAPLIANQMQAFQLGLGAASSFIVALVVMTVLGFSWRHLGLDLEQSE